MIYKCLCPQSEGSAGASSVWIVHLSVFASVYSNCIDITCPWGGPGSRCRTYRLYEILTSLPPGASVFQKHIFFNFAIYVVMFAVFHRWQEWVWTSPTWWVSRVWCRSQTWWHNPEWWPSPWASSPCNRTWAWWVICPIWACSSRWVGVQTCENSACICSWLESNVLIRKSFCI